MRPRSRSHLARNACIAVAGGPPMIRCVVIAFSRAVESPCCGFARFQLLAKMTVYALHDVDLNPRRPGKHSPYCVIDFLESAFEIGEKCGRGRRIIRELDRAAPQCHEEFQIPCRDDVGALDSFIRTLYLITEQATDNPGGALAPQQRNRPGFGRQNLPSIDCDNVARTICWSLECPEDLLVRYFLVLHRDSLAADLQCNDPGQKHL